MSLLHSKLLDIIRNYQNKCIAKNVNSVSTASREAAVNTSIQKKRSNISGRTKEKGNVPERYRNVGITKSRDAAEVLKSVTGPTEKRMHGVPDAALEDTLLILQNVPKQDMPGLLSMT